MLNGCGRVCTQFWAAFGPQIWTCYQWLCSVFPRNAVVSAEFELTGVTKFWAAFGPQMCKNGVRFGTYGETRTLVKRARLSHKYRVLEGHNVQLHMGGIVMRKHIGV